MVTEIFTIFLPCWEVGRHQAIRREALEAIGEWEKIEGWSALSGRSYHSGSTAAVSAVTGWKPLNSSVKSSTSHESVLTMSALEQVYERNSAPLQLFSALGDFSGENIALFFYQSPTRIRLYPLRLANPQLRVRTAKGRNWSGNALMRFSVSMESSSALVMLSFPSKSPTISRT